MLAEVPVWSREAGVEQGGRAVTITASRLGAYGESGLRVAVSATVA